MRVIEGPLASVHDVRPEALEYDGPAEQLRTAAGTESATRTSRAEPTEAQRPSSFQAGTRALGLLDWNKRYISR